MEFLDYEGLAKFKELLDSENGDKFATKQEITAKENTSVINPDNTQEKNNDNQVYFMFDEDSGNQDKSINLFINRDNDFNESHVGVKSYHFMNGLGCPTDGLNGEYSYIVAKGFIKAGEGEVPSEIYTKAETDALLNEKADVATTLAGYGITDAYTKTEVDTSLSAKADSSTVYTKEEVDAMIAELRALINPTPEEP